ncbi:MAG: hypothetical protein ACI3ZQ_09145 [Candidatus Cryptobacteroides sp.]
MDMNALHFKKDKAKYALLLSMALDKNYIDMTTDSIIAPAVKYYAHHGSADERLKMNYYMGRIYCNSGDNERGMKCYVKAERYVNKSVCYSAIGRLYAAKGFLYNQIYDFDDAIENYRSSAKYHIRANNLNNYIDSQLKLCNLYLIINAIDSVYSQLNIIEEYWEYLSDWQKSDYYSHLLAIASVSDVDGLVNDYINALRDSSKVRWMAVANAYNKSENIEKGVEALQQYRKYNPDFQNSVAYFSLHSNLMNKSGDFRTAYEDLAKYVDLSDRDDMNIFNGNTKSVENVELTEYKNTIQKMWLSILVLGITVIALVLMILVAVLRRNIAKRKVEKCRLEQEKAEIEKERVKYERLYNQAKKETKYLRILVDSTKIDDTVRLAVSDRLNVLNKFIMESITCGVSKSASQELEKLVADRSSFLDSTRMSFIMVHPNFVKYLQSAGLTEKEIGCCCLYCMGLNGCEIAAYLNRSSIYNLSSGIRKKLGLEKYETNLNIFLVEKMEFLD